MKLALSATALVVAVFVAPPADVTGVVFNDANGNGVRDSGENGMAGVAVSNQDTVVTTDASGAFRITERNLLHKSCHGRIPCG